MSLTSLKVAITGASGFVGRNAAAYLAQEGIDVTAVVRPAKEKMLEELGAKVKIIEDIAAEGADVVEELVDVFVGQDAVIHLTYISDYDLKNFERRNTIANQNVINAAMRAGVKKFITNSGLGVAAFGRKKETTNGYFRMKKRLEEDLVKAWHTTGMRYVIFRPSYIVGKDDEITPTLVQKIRSREPILVIGNGRYRIQPIFVRDVMKIYSMCLMSRDFDNQIFDLVGPKRISYVDYIKLLGKIIQREPLVEYIPKAEAVRRKVEFGLNENEIDVLMSDETGNEKMLQKTFDLQLTPLEKALEKISGEIV